MDRTSDRSTVHERQVRVIGLLSSIEDPELLARIERLIDGHRSGLRPLDDAEMAAVLDDLRHDLGPI